MAAKKLTPQEIATLKIFSAYASKTGDKAGSKGYNARLSDLTSNIRYEMAKTKKPIASKPAATKPAATNSNAKAIVESKEKVYPVQTISGKSFRKTVVNGKVNTFKAKRPK